MHSTLFAIAAACLVLIFGAPRPTVAEEGPAIPGDVRGGAAEHEFPVLLSRTGYFSDTAGLAMHPEFVPYRINAAPWSDGGFKQRFLRLPEGKAATWTPDGAYEFPAETVLLQNILILPRDLKLRRLETRVIVVKESGLAFGTYAWRPDQLEADLVLDGGRIDIETDTSFQLWKVTSTKKCNECHAAGAQPLLGLTTEQLNLEVDGRNQLAALGARGLLTGLPEDHTKLPRLVDPHDASHDLDRRARSYLDVNCSSCHKPGGNGSGTMDLRFDTRREESGLGEYHEVMLDGKPFSSWIYKRMIYTDDDQMPSELTIHVDTEGADLIRDWVESKKDG